MPLRTVRRLLGRNGQFVLIVEQKGYKILQKENWVSESAKTV
jgi:hypothetical protein